MRRLTYLTDVLPILGLTALMMACGYNPRLNRGDSGSMEGGSTDSSTGTGGTLSVDGSTQVGGATTSGGSMASGGTMMSGGSMLQGGVAISGGRPSQGGGTVTVSGGSMVLGGSVASGGTTSSGGGGVVGAGGSGGSVGGNGTGGSSNMGGKTSIPCNPACTADKDCIAGSCVAATWGGMTCSSTPECPSWATCCNGSSPACDGTRLPVNDGSDTGRFVVSGQGLTINDTVTGLVWQRDGFGTRAGCSGADSETCMWDEAKDYCANLILGGVAGWRLPGRMELYTTVDLTKSNPAIDLTVFPNTPAKCFWSAAQSSIVSGTAWFVEFYYGGSIYDSKSRQCNVRCVR